MGEDSTKTLGNVIRIDDERIQDHPRSAVRPSTGIQRLLHSAAEALAPVVLDPLIVDPN